MHMSSIAPHKSQKMWNQSWAKKSASEKLPILTENCQIALHAHVRFKWLKVISGLFEKQFDIDTLKFDISYLIFSSCGPLGEKHKRSAGDGALCDAVKDDNSKAVDSALKMSGTNVDGLCDEDYGFTPLYYAIKLQNLDIVKKLIEHGADARYVHTD